MTCIANILTQLRASLWLIPALISGLTVALAVYRDENGRLCVRAKPHDFTGLLDASFNQIRQAARGDAAVPAEADVMIRLLPNSL